MQAVKCPDLATDSRGKESKIKYIRNGSRKLTKDEISPYIRRLFTNSNNDRIPADVNSFQYIIERESEREGGEDKIITHSSFINQGATLFSLEECKDFQELDQDKLMEITTTYCCLYKGGAVTSLLTVPFVTYS